MYNYTEKEKEEAMLRIPIPVNTGQKNPHETLKTPTSPPFTIEEIIKMPYMQDDHVKESMQPLQDNVNHPSHYKGANGVECIQAIEAALSPEEFLGFLRGNVLKYNFRGSKKNGVEDYKKGQWYSNLLIKKLEEVTT